VLNSGRRRAEVISSGPDSPGPGAGKRYEHGRARPEVTPGGRREHIEDSGGRRDRLAGRRAARMRVPPSRRPPDGRRSGRTRGQEEIRPRGRPEFRIASAK